MTDALFQTPPEQPLDWLQSWIDEAATLSPLHEPMAMSLATVSDDGRPSSRIVLFKGLADGQIHFYTNYDSRKGVQLQHNPQAALCFWWDPLMRQIRIEGRCEKLDAPVSDAYFASRARGSQLGAWASQQSQPISSRAAMEQAFTQAEQRFAGQAVSRPPHWGGYGLRIQRIEFWQGRDNRFHDRTLFVQQSNGWQHQRLQP